MGEVTSAGVLDDAPAGAGARRATRWTPAIAFLAFVLLAIAAAVLQASYRGGLDLNDVALTVGFFMFTVVGAGVAVLRPANPIGWILCLVGVAAILSTVALEYVRAAEAGADLPGVTFMAWLNVWIWAPSLGPALIALPVLFPTGHLPGAPWRRIVAVATVAFLFPVVSLAFAPGPMAETPTIDNPFGIPALGPLFQTGEAVLVPCVIGAAVVCAAAPVARYRSSGVEERHQLRWFAFAAILVVVALTIEVIVGQVAAVPLAIAVALVPIAIGIAILRYRLYDIDVIISQTLVWVPLTALLGGLFAALIALLQRVFISLTGDKSDAAVVISTLVIAGIFTPARKALESVVDRRYRNARPSPAAAPSTAPTSADQMLDREYLRDPDLVRLIETVVDRSLQAATDERAASSGTERRDH